MTKTCIPTNHRETPATMSKISSMIFKRLSTTIPAPNIKLSSLLTPYAANRDGYGALFGMAQNLLPYIRPTTAGWGPKWTLEQDPSTYVASLQAEVRNRELMHSHRYSAKEQSLEMLHQGMQGNSFSAACSLKTQLDIHIFNNPGDTIPPRFTITETINSFNDHAFPCITFQEVAPIVNNVRGKKLYKPFDYTNKIQCECCHTFGHNIGDQICRTGAHTYHSLNYQKTHPKEFKDNAKSFNNIHNQHNINTNNDNRRSNISRKLTNNRTTNTTSNINQPS